MGVPVNELAAILEVAALTPPTSASLFNLLVNTNNVAAGGSTNLTTNVQFRLTLNNLVSGYAFVVYWGDGSRDYVTCGLAVAPVSVASFQSAGASTSLGTVVLTGLAGNSPSLLHTYAAAGTYTVSIAPTQANGLPAIAFADSSLTTTKSSDCLKVTQISQWGTNPWITLQNAFQGCNNLTITATDTATAQTQAITNWSSAFRENSSLTSFPLLNFSGATLIQNTWQNCILLTSFPLINTGSVTDTSRAWSGCTGLTAFPLINTGSVTNMFATWAGCTGLLAFPLINTANCVSFLNNWSGCTGLTAFPLINTAAGINFGNAWSNCSGLLSFPALNLAAGTAFNATWSGCSSMVTFSPTLLTSATSLGTAFNACAALTTISITLSSTVFVALNSTFSGCTALNTKPITNGFLANAVNSMFLNDPVFNVDLSGWSFTSDTAVSISGSSMFSGATAFNNGGAAGIGSWNMARFTSFSSMFQNDTAFNQALTNWNVESITTMSAMFSGATAFRQDIGAWLPRSCTVFTTFFSSVDMNVGGSPTNLVVSAQAFDAAGWTKTNATVTANAIAAPDGAVTADRLKPSVTNSTDHSAKQTVTVVNATGYTIRCAFKADAYTWGQLLVTGAITADIYVNLSTGAIESSTGSVSVTDVGGGWYVLEITGTSTTTSLVVQMKAWDNATGTSFAGDAVKGIYLWQGSAFDGGSTANYSGLLKGWVGWTGGGSGGANRQGLSSCTPSGGTGYTVGDILAVSGGTVDIGVGARVRVSSVNGSGTPTAVTVVRESGNYSVTPSDPAATTGGTGTGCTITTLVFATKFSRLQTLRTPNFGTAKYSMKDADAINARKKLTTATGSGGAGWTITDGGVI